MQTTSIIHLDEYIRTVIPPTGRFDTATGNSRFIVDSVEQLAASCDTKLSLAQLRGAASATRMVKARRGFDWRRRDWDEGHDVR